MARDSVKDTVIGAVRDVSERPGLPTLLLETDERLFGEQGKLDSLGLVELVVAVEEHVQDELGVRLTLSDERVLDRPKSPFATVGDLIDFVDDIVGDSIVV